MGDFLFVGKSVGLIAMKVISVILNTGVLNVHHISEMVECLQSSGFITSEKIQAAINVLQKYTGG